MEEKYTIAELCKEMKKFVAERDWDQYHTPKNLAMSITIEAAELMEHFQWLNNERSIELLKNPLERSKVVDELADIFLYCLSFVNILEFIFSAIIIRIHIRMVFAR